MKGRGGPETDDRPKHQQSRGKNLGTAREGKRIKSPKIWGKTKKQTRRTHHVTQKDPKTQGRKEKATWVSTKKRGTPQKKKSKN